MIWRVRRAAHELSWLTVVAAALFAFDAAFHVSALEPALTGNEALAVEVQRLRAAGAEAANRETASNPELDLAAFYKALPRPAEMPDLLRRLLREAESQGLEVQKGEYRPLPDPGGKLRRYQIALPARGKYPDVRRFLAQAAREVPGLAVDSIAFQRQDVGAPVLEAQIKLTLFVGAEG